MFMLSWFACDKSVKIVLAVLVVAGTAAIAAIGENGETKESARYKILYVCKASMATTL